MPMLDVFRGDAFGVTSLTTAMNKLPYKPKRLGEMGLFAKSGITTTTVVVEEQNGKIMLVPNAARGSNPNVVGGKKRNARSFVINHLPVSSAVMADDVQNIRAFGSETEIQTIAALVNDKLTDLRNSLEATIEFYRAKAIQGKLVDADGTTIYDWYTEFGIAPQTSDVAFGTADLQAIKKSATGAIRIIQDNLGNDSYSRIRCLCGKTFYDTVSQAVETRNAYDRWQESSFLRGNVVRSEFEYAGVIYEEYRGTIGTQVFVPDVEGWYFPEGASDVFSEVYGPADYTETVNTRGIPFYAKQERMKMDKGIEIEAQSNPLVYCSRPSVLVKALVTGTAPVSAVVTQGPGVTQEGKTVK